jgi:hypothetical protein
MLPKIYGRVLLFVQAKNKERGDNIKERVRKKRDKMIVYSNN